MARPSTTDDDSQKRAQRLAAVGGRIRSLRESHGMSLRDLSEQAGLSIGFLSQVERGLSSIGLLPLHEVAQALDVTVGEFFTERPGAAADQRPDAGAYVVRGGQRPDHTVVTGERTFHLLSRRAADLVLEPILVHISPGEVREEPYAHDGEEFAYVLTGELLFTVGGTDHRLGPGDSIHFRSEIPHTMINDTDELCTVISVLTPRLY